MFNVRVEYDRAPIRHISVQCPKCNKWFYGWNILKGEKTFDVLKYAHDINFAEFECPVCGAEFGGLQHADKPNVKEVGYPEVYEGCVQKKEVWE